MAHDIIPDLRNKLERNLTIKIARMSQKINSMMPNLENCDTASDYVDDLLGAHDKLSTLICDMQDLVGTYEHELCELGSKEKPDFAIPEEDLRDALDIGLGNN